jgi:hypothetical protein
MGCYEIPSPAAREKVPDRADEGDGLIARREKSTKRDTIKAVAISATLTLTLSRTAGEATRKLVIEE